MANHEYEPWRREGPVHDPLAERVGRRWESLIAQSKEAVAALREATAEAEARLHVGTAGVGAAAGEHSLGAGHERLARRLDEFEARLERIERALARGDAGVDEGAAPHKLPMPPRQSAA